MTVNSITHLIQNIKKNLSQIQKKPIIFERKKRTKYEHKEHFFRMNLIVGN